MNKPMNLAAGLALGATVMYLLDPNKGKRRRAVFRDRMNHLVHQTEKSIDVSSRDLTHRVQGIVAQTRGMLPHREHHVSDDLIEKRVRSKIGRVVSHPHAIGVCSQNGEVTLSGLILTHEVAPLISTILGVPGVAGIQNRLEAHPHPENIPSLQGGIPRLGRRIDLLQTHWSPSTRLLMGISGVAATTYGLRRHNIPRGILSTLGILSLVRSITDRPLKHFLSTSEAQGGVHIHKTINIHAPVHEVYSLFMNPTWFPAFIKELPVAAQIPNKVISWSQPENSLLKISGCARLFQVDSDRTKIEMDFTYVPPLGEIGHALARVLGYNLKSRLETSILRIKQILEQGMSAKQARQMGRSGTQYSSSSRGTLGAAS